MRIAVLGAGSWGTTLAVLLTENSHRVSLWSFREEDAAQIRATRENPAFLPGVHVPDTVAVTSDIAAAVDGAEMIVAAVPSQFLRSVMLQIADYPFDRATVVNVAKGVENGTLLTMSEMLHDALPALPPSHIATLSGPSHAEEVSRKIPTTVVAASLDMGTARKVQRVFMNPSFRVYGSNDIRGVEIGGFL